MKDTLINLRRFVMKLNITLGHNAAAALFDAKGKCIVAYEEERLTKVKSDSSFPKLAIEKCATWILAGVLTEIRVSTWFDNGNLPENKYYLPKYLSARFPMVPVIISTETHHDQHANSVWNFSKTEEGLTLVMDGFGNDEECISIYRDGQLIKRIVGYEYSLGLMFQYATSAAGLKENEDEYKLLGYEIDSLIDKPQIIDFPKVNLIGGHDELINYKKLRLVREYYHKQFKGMDRVDIARTAQYNLEARVMQIISDYYGGGLVQLSGGVFYNVKLNNLIMRNVEQICVNPVAGDQGNVFGYKGLSYDNLFLGKRQIKAYEPIPKRNITESFQGAMEFGPRALGNTSTLAMPTMENVRAINTYNHRNTVMPMAPIVTREFFEDNFNDTGKVLKSEKYMIVSFDFKTMKDAWRGAAHYDPQREVYTGRVQVVDFGDKLYEFVNNAGGIMINTSLNFHGTPILYDNTDLHRYHDLINQ